MWVSFQLVRFSHLLFGGFDELLLKKFCQSTCTSLLVRDIWPCVHGQDDHQRSCYSSSHKACQLQGQGLWPPFSIVCSWTSLVLLIETHQADGFAKVTPVKVLASTAQACSSGLYADRPGAWHVIIRQSRCKSCQSGPNDSRFFRWWRLKSSRHPPGKKPQVSWSVHSVTKMPCHWHNKPMLFDETLLTDWRHAWDQSGVLSCVGDGAYLSSNRRRCCVTFKERSCDFAGSLLDAEKPFVWS